MKKDYVKTLSISLPSSLIKEAKQICYERGCTLSGMIRISLKNKFEGGCEND
jgi:rhamnogalacturonyl hydrolase YesR